MRYLPLLVLTLACQSSHQLGLAAIEPRDVRVSDSYDLQVALDQANPGDVILLKPEVVYQGNFVLRRKPSGPPIVIRTDIDLPAGRIDPRAGLAKIVGAGSSPALEFLPNADNYRIVGVELTVERGTYSNDVIRVGSLSATTADEQPTNIFFDRIYVHGDPNVGSKRGLMISGRQITLINSHISDFKSRTQDAMAVAVCNSPGDIYIDNNYLEGAAHGIIFGGCRYNIPNLIVSDVTFRRNHVSRPLEWQAEDWSVKNAFEIKGGRRFLIFGNIFENVWPKSQVGFAILFTAKPDGARSSGERFTVIEDVRFESNIVRNSAHGINISSGNEQYAENPGQPSVRNVHIENNLFLAVPGRLFQLLQSMRGVELLFNSSLDTETAAMVSSVRNGEQIEEFVMRGNIFRAGSYGIKGSGESEGTGTLDSDFVNPDVRDNLFVDADSARYPVGNSFLSGLLEFALDGLSLREDSPFRGIVSGRDPGVDLELLERATEGVVSGGRTFPVRRQVVRN